jgi:flagellar biosynthesis anti-sigma factor FlgM
MRIENNGIQPLSTKQTQAPNPVEKREGQNGVHSVNAGQDKVEMSENARLLAKARIALENADETDAERLAMLKQQIESGDYTVRVSDLARKLLAKIYPK